MELGDIASSMAHAVLGPFEVHDVIGQGGMGIVFSGVHLEQNVPVAIKVITRSGAEQPRFRQTMQNEVRAVAGLDHPGVVRVLDFGLIPDGAESVTDGALRAGSPYFAMEMVPHGSLVDYVGRVSWAQARSILLSLLDALAHSHAREVIHRDLKPGNILVGDWGGKMIPRLADFGLAFAAGTPTDASRSIGTPQYMAPEQIETPWRKHGPWSDLYSVGCIAYELLCGRKLFGGKSVLEIFHQHLDGHRKPMRSIVKIPKEFDGWLERMLARSPQERFQSAADAARALARIPVLHDGPRAPDPVEAEFATLTPVLAAITSEPDREPLDGEFSWPKRFPTSMRLVGAGLGLFGLRETPLTGRAAELSTLWEELRRCSTEGARLVFVDGAHGVGKTKLARAFIERLSELGIATVMRAEHGPEHGLEDGLPGMVARHARALGATRPDASRVVREHLRARGVEDLYQWRAVAAVIEPALGAETVREERPGGFDFASNEQRWEAVLQYLRAHADSGPVVAVLDDANLDADTLDFLTYALERDLDAPFLFIATSTPDEVARSEASGATIAALRAHERAATVELQPLDELAHLGLVEELLMLSRDVALEVADRTAGNPGFAVSLIGEWVRRGYLEVGETGFVPRRGALREVPESADELWRSTLDDLAETFPEEAWMAMEVAAALGRTVRAAEWTGVCQLLEFEPNWALVDTLVERRLIIASGYDWSFEHPLVMESLKSRASEAARWMDWKRACATYVESSGVALGPEELERVGGYWLEAGEYDAALEPLRASARSHQQRGDYRRAERLSNGIVRALESLEKGDVELVEVYLFRAASYVGSAQPEEVLRWAKKAHEIGEREGRPSVVARAAGYIAVGKQWLGDASAAEWVERAFAHLDELGDDFEPGGVLVVLGYLLTSLGRFSEARQVLDIDREAALRAGEPLALAKNGYQYCRLGVHSRDYDVALKHGREAAELYEEAGQIPALASLKNMLGEVYRKTGSSDAAEQMYRDVIALQESVGRPTEVARVNLAQLLLQQGDVGAAEEAFVEAAAGLRAAGRRRIEMVCRAGLIACAARSRDWAAANRLLPEVQEFVEVSQEAEVDLAELLEEAGSLLSNAGRFADAVAVWRVARTQWRLLGDDESADEVDSRIRALGGK